MSFRLQSNAAANKCGQKVTIDVKECFDHSHHFIVAFIENNVEFHGKRLRKKQQQNLDQVKYGFLTTQGRSIQCKAMVARATKQPLAEEIITVLSTRRGLAKSASR
jgi:S-(hydroxymethyl)glutathione dehydrogenase/alcohol dehydrogenase